MPRSFRDLVLLSLFLILVLFSCLSISGAGVPAAMSITGIVTVQVASGSLAWSLFRRSSQSVFELVGVGAALGIAFSILIGLTFRPTIFSPISWIVLPIFVAIAVVILKALGQLKFSVLEPPRKCDIVALGLGLIFGIFLLAEFWIGTTLNLDNDTHLYVDLPFHEALSNGIAKYGPSDSVLSAGDTYRYHWFSHAWIGFTQMWSGATPPLVIQTRALPLLSLIVLTCVTIAWIKKVTRHQWAPAVAVLLICAGTATGAGAGVVFLARSPSHILGIALMLATLYLAYEYIFDELKLQTLVLVAILSFIVIGTKSSVALPLCVGLIALAIYLVKRRHEWTRTLTAGTVVAVSFVAGYFYALAGSDGGMTIDFQASMALWGFNENNSPFLMSAVGVVLSLMSLVPILLAVVFGFGSSRLNVRAVCTVGMASGLAGIVVVSTFTHPGQSQAYFLSAAFPVLTIAATVGLASIVDSGISSSRLLFTAAIYGFLVQAAMVMVQFIPISGPRYIWPILIWLAAVICGILLAKSKNSMLSVPLKKVGAIVAAFLVAAQFTTGIANGFVSLSQPDKHLRNPPLKSNEIDAANWLSDNTGDIRIATNRFCWNPSDQPTDCNSTVFTAAAFSGKRVLVEGYKYRVGSSAKLNPDERESIKKGVRFTKDPSCNSLDFLKAKGVEYMWIDKRYTDRRTWEPYATIEYSNPTVSIVKLNDSAC